MAGGWCYVKEIVMPNYADYFVREGFAALIFDYRSFGASEGKLRQHLDPWWQIEDYRNAISYAETLPEVDAERIAIWGISYSCLLYTSPSPRDQRGSRMPSSA